jgi:hypothetical protein
MMQQAFGDVMKARWVYVAICVLLAAQPASGQRLLEEWRVRSTAGPDALVPGGAAVFWNPAQVVVAGRGEVVVLDLRAPRITGIRGLAAAAAVALDERTTLALGYEHIGVDGVERTTTSPDGGSIIDLAENRVGIAASHVVNGRTRVGALVQYTRLPEVAAEASVMALGAGIVYRPLERVPLELTGMGVTEGDAAHWAAGVEFASGERWPDWRARLQYGAAGGELAPGSTHRVAAAGEWRRQVELTVGLASEPDGASRSLEPVVGAEIRLHRYRLGVVREQLPNEFGAAYSFRFAAGF